MSYVLRIAPLLLLSSALLLPALAQHLGGPPAGVVPDDGPALSASRAPTFKDVRYAGVSATQALDIYLPEGGGPFPVVFYLHPGGFRFGSKDRVDAVPGKALLDAGYGVASINYRLSREAAFPAAVQDAKAAVRFVRANAARFRLDPSRFGAWGESAGANLAALIGTTGNAATIFDAPELGNAGVSSAVGAVADWYGPNDFLAIDPMLRAQGCPAGSIDHDSASGFESEYLGGALPTVRSKVAQADPITYIDAADPPFQLENGDADCNVGAGQGRLLLTALRKAKVPVTLEMVQGAGHGGPAFQTPGNARTLVAFFDRYIGRGATGSR